MGKVWAGRRGGLTSHLSNTQLPAEFSFSGKQKPCSEIILKNHSDDRSFSIFFTKLTFVVYLGKQCVLMITYVLLVKCCYFDLKSKAERRKHLNTLTYFDHRHNVGRRKHLKTFKYFQYKCIIHSAIMVYVRQLYQIT